MSEASEFARRQRESDLRRPTFRHGDSFRASVNDFGEVEAKGVLVPGGVEGYVEWLRRTYAVPLLRGEGEVFPCPVCSWPLPGIDPNLRGGTVESPRPQPTWPAGVSAEERCPVCSWTMIHHPGCSQRAKSS